MTLADADAQWQQQTRQRQQQQWQRDDSSNAHYEASLQAGRKAMEEDRRQYEQAGAAPQPGAPVWAYQPSRTALLKTAQAQTDELFKRGRMDQGMKAWVQAEGLRGQLRAQAGQKLMQTMAAGGDIIQALRELDNSVDDDLEIKSVKRIQGRDGAPAFEIRQRNRLTGASVQQANVVTTQEMELRVAKLLADPKEKAMDRANDAIDRWNEKQPERDIGMRDFNRSIGARQRRIDEAEDGVYLPRSHCDALDAGRFAREAADPDDDDSDGDDGDE